jgi:hypothetical protein
MTSSKGEHVVHGLKALKALKSANERITKKQKKEGRAVCQSQYTEVRNAKEQLQSDWYDLEA